MPLNNARRLSLQHITTGPLRLRPQQSTSSKAKDATSNQSKLNNSANFSPEEVAIYAVNITKSVSLVQGENSVQLSEFLQDCCLVSVTCNIKCILK